MDNLEVTQDPSLVVAMFLVYHQRLCSLPRQFIVLLLRNLSKYLHFPVFAYVLSKVLLFDLESTHEDVESTFAHQYGQSSILTICGPRQQLSQPPFSPVFHFSYF